MTYTRREYDKMKAGIGVHAAMLAAAVLLAGSLLFGYLAYAERVEDSMINEEWDDVRAAVNTREEPDSASTGGTYTDAGSEEGPTPAGDMHLYNPIDWKELLSINGDVLCWLWIPGTEIDYPVMQEQEYGKTFYLDHDIRKGYSKSGCIFRTMPREGSARNMSTILFGHHMKNGSMFGSLTRYRDVSYYAENPYIYLYYPDHVEKWEIWAAENVLGTDVVYREPYEAGTEEYGDMLAFLKENALYSTPASSSVDADREILLLSTCDRSFNSTAGRFVVAAVKTSDG